ncbi:hypothetical protein MKW98_007545 [Papaver atlanticum]|uniref:BED-type domain-containing protein n=1 Tax=Papaver atlanticum TaxID=357466 RepID=A0AAD4SBE1_9MAGN|nr:hypothetical protein MKW98_007545 [Papaver atlanticum]
MTKQDTKKAKVNEASTSSTDVPEGRDIAWEWVEYDDRKLRRVKCKLCGHIMSGGINRLKNHILQIKGEVKSCPKATPEIMKKINDKKKEKNEKQANRERIDRIYNEDMLTILEENDDEVVAVESMETKKKKLKMSDVRSALDLLFKSDLKRRNKNQSKNSNQLKNN